MLKEKPIWEGLPLGNLRHRLPDPTPKQPPTQNLAFDLARDIPTRFGAWGKGDKPQSPFYLDTIQTPLLAGLGPRVSPCVTPSSHGTLAGDKS